VLASDGLWDVMSNEEVVKIVNPIYNKGEEPRIAVTKLMDEAHIRWADSKANADDITIILIFINSPMI